MVRGQEGREVHRQNDLLIMNGDITFGKVTDVFAMFLTFRKLNESLGNCI